MEAHAIRPQSRVSLPAGDQVRSRNDWQEQPQNGVRLAWKFQQSLPVAFGIQRTLDTLGSAVGPLITYSSGYPINSCVS